MKSRLRLPRPSLRQAAVLTVAAGLLAVGTPGPDAAAQRDGSGRIAPVRTGRPVFPAGLNLGTSKIKLNPQAPGPVNVAVELSDPPTAQVWAQALTASGSLSSSAAVSVAASAVRTQSSRIQAAQTVTLSTLRGPSIGAQVLWQTQRSFNGIAIRVDGSKLTQVAQLPGVVAVRPLASMSRENAVSVPLIGAPAAWVTGAGGRGDGVKLGVIDTGVDYLHSNFGGPGTPGAYAANNTTVIGDTLGFFPGPKVAGGFDFAGDNYDADGALGSPLPSPDPDPMDCSLAQGGSHGSHVAGTAAGMGVNADGSSFAGPYDGSVPFSSLRIGPGVAPKALIYPLRVFGCNDGTTNLVAPAMDWAIDPNGDNDFSDRLDVVNLSLGANNGTGDDASAVALENAALAGIITVASAGNAGDTYFVSGSPATSTRAISVAASQDSTDVADGFQVTAPAGIANVYASFNASAFDWASKPDVIGQLAYPATQPTGCSAFNLSNAALLAGKIALLDWSSDCGSAARTANAFAAGAIGVIIAFNAPILDIAIAGIAQIPATITPQAVGTLLKANIAAPVTVRLSGTFTNTQKIVIPGRTDLIASFSSRGPRADGLLKPDITAPGQSTFSTSALTGNQGTSLNGTSMAAPHVAGAMAILRQLHPTWTVEELKALVMNTATHNLFTGLGQTGSIYGTGRVGAGRIDVANAAVNNVVAFAEDSGGVSLSFGAFQAPVGQIVTRSKNVRLVNKGTTPATFQIGYAPTVDAPGVNVALATRQNPVTVPAGGMVVVPVQLSVDLTALRHTREASVSATQIGAGRQYLTEETGYLTLTPAGAGQPLRVPVYAAPRATSSMAAEQAGTTLTGPSGTLNLRLSGASVDTGANYPVDVTSLVSGYELGATSPRNPALTGNRASADIKAVGVHSDFAAAGSLNNTEIFFAIATYADRGSPHAAEAEFDILIDVNRDGIPEWALFNTRLTDGNNATDVYVSALCSLSTFACTAQDFTNGIPGNVLDTAIYNTNVVALGVFAADLGLNPANPRFNYQVVSFARIDNGVTDVVGSLSGASATTFDPTKPGLDLSGGLLGIPAYFDRARSTLAVNYNTANYQANRSQGLLLIHHHNAAGSRDQIVNLTIPSGLTPR